ncbi:MAG: hypothetical protein WCN81_00670 [Actinomycetes bacterium]
MKKPLPVAALVALIAVIALIASGTALAAPTVQPASATSVNAVGVPAGSVLVMNFTYGVRNDEAYANVGYWALTSYIRHVQAWRLPDGAFYWTSQWAGTWTTFKGALSPGAAVTQSAGGSGIFTAVLDGTFDASSYIPAFGCLGTHDYRGTKVDILLGTPEAGQAGPSAVWSPGDIYFPGEDWSTWTTVRQQYTYYYKHQTFKVTDTGTMGDIVITK